MTQPRTAVILGGGLAGLVCADELARAGVQVTVLEKLPVVGGLARNVRRQGANFDLGGHRFFTEQPRLLAWLRELVGDSLREVARKSRIRLNGRYFDYPLKPLNALSGFGLTQTARILADYSRAAVRRRLTPASELSLEDWVINRFGQALYEIYFRPYSVKAWGLPCDQVSAEWAAQRIQLMNLSEAIWRAVSRGGRSPKTYAAKFWYPVGGIGVMAEALAERVRTRGGRVLTAASVTGLSVRDGRVAAAQTDAGEFPAEVFISTLPLTNLGRMIGAPEAALAGLAYRAIRCVLLLIAAPRVTDDTWLYFPESDVLFARLHEPRNWDPGMAPPGQTSLCLEIFCDEGDDLWRRDEADLVTACVRDLHRLGLVPETQVREGFVENVAAAYPVFRVGYKQSLRAVLAAVEAVENLHVVGRTGAYRYENMDQVAESAMTLAARLVYR
jgi:protoporphyrinogen oxidase